MENKKVLLSIKDVKVKFRVRGRILTAIRGVSLDIYENESIAIVGESGSGKSVFTKTFAGMLDSNGFISDGRIIFNDEELSDTVVKYDASAKSEIQSIQHKLDEFSKLEAGAATYREILALESDKRQHLELSTEEKEKFEVKLQTLKEERTKAFNLKQTLDPKNEKDQIKELSKKIKAYDEQIKEAEKEKEAAIKAHKTNTAKDTAYLKS